MIKKKKCNRKLKVKKVRKIKKSKTRKRKLRVKISQKIRKSQRSRLRMRRIRNFLAYRKISYIKRSKKIN